MDEPKHFHHPAYGRVVQLVNDVRINFNEGKGTLGEVADLFIDAVLQHPVSEYVDEADALAAEIYNQKAKSPRPMTPERWAYIKAHFGASARICRQEAMEELEWDYDCD